MVLALEALICLAVFAFLSRGSRVAGWLARRRWPAGRARRLGLYFLVYSLVLVALFWAGEAFVGFFFSDEHQALKEKAAVKEYPVAYFCLLLKFVVSVFLIRLLCQNGVSRAAAWLGVGSLFYGVYGAWIGLALLGYLPCLMLSTDVKLDGLLLLLGFHHASAWVLSVAIFVEPRRREPENSDFALKQTADSLADLVQDPGGFLKL